MKKSKILMPLTAVAALGTIAPIVTLASCNKSTEITVTEIKAKLEKTSYFVGEKVAKTDIVVTAINSDGTKDKVTDWTCTDFDKGDYMFDRLGYKTFTIKYKGLTTTVKASAEYYGYLTFEKLVTPTLVYNTGFATEASIRVWGRATSQGGELKEIDLSLLDIIPSNANVTYNATKKTIVAAGTGNCTITAHWHGLESKAYDATFDVTVTDNTAGISAATKVEDEDEAAVTLKSGVSSDEKILTVPEYVKINNQDLPVTQITVNKDVTNVETLILPATITSISGSLREATSHLQGVLFMGTSEQFRRDISYDDNWEGDYLTGAWCYGDEEPTFVNFDRHYDAKFDSESKEFDYAITNLTPRRQYVVGFDMWDTKEEETPVYQDFNTIEISSLGVEIGNMPINGLFIDGVTMTKVDTDPANPGEYKVTGSNYDKVITFKAPADFDMASRILIKFTTPYISAARIEVNLSKK